jgi:hypothetical protein
MKYLAIIFMMFVITSCVQVEDDAVKNDSTIKVERIKIKEEKKSFIIIEVDGKEYLSRYKGGIIELKKDKNE